jgi:hypothetical protein
MTTALLEKNMTFLNNTKGEMVAVQLDLKDKLMKQFFEDLMDTITVIERQEEPTIPLEQVRKEILSSRKMVLK